MGVDQERFGVLRRLLDPIFGVDEGGSRNKSFPRRLLQLCVLTCREFRQDLCWERAATLSFVTVISLLPIGFLFLGLISLTFETDEEFQDYINDKVLVFFLPDVGRDTVGMANPLGAQLVTESERPGETSEPLTGSENGVGNRDFRRHFEAWIENNITRDKFEMKVRNNVLALIALVVSGLFLLVSMERVLNRIWHVARARSYFQKFVAFWMVLTLCPVLIAASFKIKTSELPLYDFVIPVVVSGIAFTVLYRFLPNLRVRFLPALAGGCFTGIVWEGLKVGFYLYFDNAMRMSAFYGSLALVPIFLIFVYCTWFIVLFGAELSCCLQNFTQLSRKQASRDLGSTHSQAYLGLAFLERVVTLFKGGADAPRLSEVADAVDTDPEELRRVVDTLTAGGILVESSGMDQYLLARSPEQVPLRDVVEKLLLEDFSVEESLFSGGSHGVTGDGQPRRAKILQREAIVAYLESFREKSLADLEDRDLGVQAAWSEAQVFAGPSA